MSRKKIKQLYDLSKTNIYKQLQDAITFSTFTKTRQIFQKTFRKGNGGCNLYANLKNLTKKIKIKMVQKNEKNEKNSFLLFEVWCLEL